MVKRRIIVHVDDDPLSGLEALLEAPDNKVTTPGSRRFALALLPPPGRG